MCIRDSCLLSSRHNNNDCFFHLNLKSKDNNPSRLRKSSPQPVPKFLLGRPDRVSQHKTDVKKKDNSALASHALNKNHHFDFTSVSLLWSYRTSKIFRTKESDNWFYQNSRVDTFWEIDFSRVLSRSTHQGGVESISHEPSLICGFFGNPLNTHKIFLLMRWFWLNFSET